MVAKEYQCASQEFLLRKPQSLLTSELSALAAPIPWSVLGFWRRNGSRHIMPFSALVR